MAKPVAVYLGVSLLSMFAVGVDCLYINGDYRWGAVALAKVRVRKSLTQQHMSHFSIGVKGGGGQHRDTGGHVRFSQPGSIKEQRHPQTYSSTSSRWTQLSQGGMVPPRRHPHEYGYGYRPPQRVSSHSQQYSQRRVFQHAHPDPHRHDVMHSVGTAHRITQNANSHQPPHYHTDPSRISTQNLYQHVDPSRVSPQRHQHPINYNTDQSRVSPVRPYYQNSHGHNIDQSKVFTQNLFQHIDQSRVSPERPHHPHPHHQHPHNHNIDQSRVSPPRPYHHHNIDQSRVSPERPHHHHGHSVDQSVVSFQRPQHHHQRHVVQRRVSHTSQRTSQAGWYPSARFTSQVMDSRRDHYGRSH
ncbi:histidine-rich glycoprotein-like isoform X1 [Anguilla rostrata]|uniref:histidine-rich glycoprotein-like isoform X1 n=1 Tax=Anguilla rostrata TaxID=7938 RepID=UPI0030D51922